MSKKMGASAVVLTGRRIAYRMENL